MMQQEMGIIIYSQKERFYLAGYTLNGLGFGYKATGESSELYEFTMEEIEEMMANYMTRNPDIVLTSTIEELELEHTQEETTSFGK